MNLTFFSQFRASLGISMLAVLFLAGCATSRDVVTPKVETGDNPRNGIAVRLDKVEDARRFELNPQDPSIPSLMDGNISDATLRSRAIARKRNTFGKALGDVLLPENQPLTVLAKDAATRSFREAGYRVVVPGDADYRQAIPVSIKIDKLWSWFRPGFWAITLESNYSIIVAAAVHPLENGQTFSGQVQNSMQFATADDWSEIVKKSLDDFSVQLKKRLSER